MNSLIGTYDVKADSKGRVMIPAPLKQQLSDVLQEGFVIKRSIFASCLELYTVRQWKKITKPLQSLSRFKKEHNYFIRSFMARVRQVEIDATGRILIPKELKEFAEIDRQVVMTSLNDYIEIWSKTFYENIVQSDSENVGQLAEQIMEPHTNETNVS